ncbi:MAG: GAF domain-containing protein [Bacillota bacterium]
MSLQRLRWVAFLVPTTVTIGLLLGIHLTDPALAHSVEGALVAGAVLITLTFFFNLWLFRILRASEAGRLSKQRQIEALNQTALALSRELDLNTLLQKVADSARELLRAQYCALQVMPDSGYRPSLVTSGLHPHVIAQMGDPPKGRGVLGLVFQSGRPVRVPVIGAHPASVGFPPGHPPMTSFLGVPIISRGKVLGQLYLADKVTASEFSPEDERIAAMLATQAAVAIENARHYEEARRREARLKSLIAASHDAIVVLRADGRVYLWNQGAENMYGWSEAEAMDRILPMVDPRDLDDALLLLAEARQEGAVANRERVHIHKDGSRLPVLLTLSHVETGADEEPHICLIAKDLTATKLMEEQRHRLMLLEERERISMDLHDGAIQALYAVGLGLGTTQMLLPAEQSTARDRISHTLEQVNEVIRQLREYIVHLREPDLGRTLDQRLGEVAERLRADGGLQVTLEVTGETTQLPQEVAVQLLHVAGEAAANVLRHAQATEVYLGFAVMPDQVVLTVRDNGRGFVLGEPTAGSGLGLRNMQARAQLLDGACEIRSAAASGTEIRLTVPLTNGRCENERPTLSGDDC